jgi:prophage antirepressor-like protein
MESKALTLFAFKNHSIRGMTDSNGMAWLAAKDVCDVLRIKNVSRAMAGLSSDEKGLHSMNTHGGEQVLNVVNEPGAYRLIMRSRQKDAVEFQRFLAHEVIPSLLHTGSYNSTLPTESAQLLGAVKDLVGLVRDLLAEKIKPALPAVRPIAQRDQVGKVVRSYATNNRLDFQACWKELYREFLYRYHIDLYQRAQAKGTTGVAVAEELGMIDDLLALANFLYIKY